MKSNNTDNTTTNQNQSIQDYQRAYEELSNFVQRTIHHSWRTTHEWNKRGDNIKKFSLYQESITPIIANNIITE